MLGMVCVWMGGGMGGLWTFQDVVILPAWPSCGSLALHGCGQQERLAVAVAWLHAVL